MDEHDVMVPDPLAARRAARRKRLADAYEIYSRWHPDDPHSHPVHRAVHTLFAVVAELVEEAGG